MVYSLDTYGFCFYPFPMKVVLFEIQDIKRFYPISLTHGLWEIKTGVLSQYERFRKHFGRVFVFSNRDYISSDTLPEGLKLFVDPMVKDPSSIPELKPGEVIYSKGRPVCFASEIPEIPENGKRIDRNIPFYSYLHEIIEEFPDNLTKDLIQMVIKDDYPNVVKAIGRQIFVHREVKISGEITVNAEKGPVFIGKGTKIEPYTYIEGPAFIGENCLIKAGTRIEGGVYLGNWTKVAGEIEHTIIHGYSNKQHHGFLGHSYIGEWVNLGAGTTNSDLKNNYSNIRIKIFDEEINTGLMFLGLLMGDHSKSAINTSFNTGTLAGPFSNIFTRDFPPKFIPPFSWVGEKMDVYRVDKAVETARKVMKRRGVEMDSGYEFMIKRLFEIYTQ